MYSIDLNTRAALTTLYSEIHRKYHTLEHIQAMLRDLNYYVNYSKDNLNEVEIGILKAAIWFHDAVYDPYSKTNEEDSAELFTTWFDEKVKNGSFKAIKTMDGNDFFFANVVNMILNSKDHTKYDGNSKLINIFLDLDLAILGKSLSYYRFYVAAVSAEYYNTPSKALFENRAKFLEKVLKQKRIYRTEYFYEKYEKQARENLNLELNDYKKILAAYEAASTKKTSEEDLKTILEKYGFGTTKKDDGKTFH